MQSAFLEALLSEARGDICTAINIAVCECSKSCDWHLKNLDEFSWDRNDQSDGKNLYVKTYNSYIITIDSEQPCAETASVASFKRSTESVDKSANNFVSFLIYSYIRTYNRCLPKK